MQGDIFGGEEFYNDDDNCLMNRRRNTTAISYLYNGIPETIILNVVTWVLLISLFAVLRNRAWDYGRLALVHTEKWTHLFYKNTDDAIAVEEASADVSLVPDTGCLWFPSIFKITREKILTRCGPDASHYLSFQQHLLLLSACITFFAITVILPVNFQGQLQGDTRSFGHTTVSNLEPDSNLLWIHIVASFAFVPLTVLIMRKSSGRNPSATVLSSRTLMITHISKNHRKPEDIKNYFSVRYPDVEILDVQLAYKVKKLMQLERERELAHEAKLYCISNHKSDLKVQPYGCIVCCPWKTKNALEYYTAEEERLTELVASERRNALSTPLGIAFVTVNSEERAQHVLNTFKPGSLRKWSIFKAPSPSDINWENLEISSRNWYSKAIFINFFLFIALFFITPPVLFVNIFNNLTVSKDGTSKINPLISEFLPTLLLLSMSAFFPVLVAYSDEWMSHWTKSKQNHATMHKTFFYLLFMVLILPSLGLTSAQAFVEWPLKKENKTVPWKCIFLADKGAFFVNYVITSALIGTGLELLRFPELAMYVWRLLRIKSEAEKPSIRKEILSEFPFGIHYTWTMLIFTVSTVYSLTCPLITPFGLLYLCLKHLVDKYNIYYVYRPITMCGEGQQIHSDAVKMVRVAIALLQLIMVAFSFIRGSMNIMCGVTLLGFIVTCFCFFFLSPFPSCKPATVSIASLSRTNERYIAPVLVSSRSVENGEDRETISTPSSYGSSSMNNIVVNMLPEIGSSIA